jgi:hypothetical protein
LFARAASCDITPRSGPVRLAGYASRTKLTSNILAPIEISAVLLEASDKRCLIFSFDLLFVGPELQELILKKLAGLGFDRTEIMLLASHTHFAPATDATLWHMGPIDRSYVDRVAASAGQLVQQIVRQPRRSVRLELRSARLDHSINRRRYWPFPTVTRTYGLRFGSFSMAPNPDAPTDERATVLLLCDTNDGTAHAALWHYACHPTAVVPSDSISPDYPGTVRQGLRSSFGDIPVVFIQGFCGDIRPKMRTSEKQDPWTCLKRAARTLLAGPSFDAPMPGEWPRWSEDLAAKVLAIAEGPITALFDSESLAVGQSAIPLDEFFSGMSPDKPLTAQVLRIGGTVEIVALSAEPSVGWNAIVDKAIPAGAETTRLYAGYLGAAFGYLPTAPQVPEGGYEVDGFQPLFGLSGRFDANRIEPAVVGCIQSAFRRCEVATVISSTVYTTRTHGF